MKFLTLIRISTADYQFNDIGELFSQLTHFGFDVETSLGLAHVNGDILESSVDQVAPDKFTINLIWREELLFYQVLVSTQARDALDYITNLGWTLEILEKDNVE